jgi:hypothetical protein
VDEEVPVKFAVFDDSMLPRATDPNAWAPEQERKAALTELPEQIRTAIGIEHFSSNDPTNRERI